MRVLCRCVVYLARGIVVLVCAVPTSNASDALQDSRPWGSHKQMVTRFTQSIGQHASFTNTVDVMNLNGERLSASNVTVAGITPLSLARHLQREFPALTQLEVAENRLTLSGQQGLTHCLIQLESVDWNRQKIVLSCVDTGKIQAQPLIRRTGLNVLWEWREQHPGQWVTQQIIEINAKDREAATSMLIPSLEKEGWSVNQTENGFAARHGQRHLVLGYLDSKEWRQTAYLIDVRPDVDISSDFMQIGQK